MGEEEAIMGEDGIGGEEEGSAVEFEPRLSRDAVERESGPWSSIEGMVGEKAMGGEEEGSMAGKEDSSDGRPREEEDERSE